MSLKRTLVTIGLAILLLLPAARLIRDQNPWTCFAFTLDEGYFAQAAGNWADGKGYRFGEGDPYDPKITVGVPMAWGASAVRAITGYDIAQSGRIFVHFCFLALLIAIGMAAYRRDRLWIGVPIGIGIFAYALSKVPFGGYFAFGFLGEMPALLLGTFAYRAIDRKRFFRAGVYAVAAFSIKPTFIFFTMAVVGAAFLHSGKGGVRSLLGTTASVAALFWAISSARGQPFTDYVLFYFHESRRIAFGPSLPTGGFLEFYEKAGLVPNLLSGLVLVAGGLGAIRSRRRLPSIAAAFLTLALPALAYLTQSKAPVEKQWWALFAMAYVSLSVHWGAEIAYRFSAFVPREFARAIVLSVILTWILANGQNPLHRFKREAETACGAKEQSAINARLRAFADRGEVTRANLGAWITNHAYDETLYGVGFEPVYRSDWREFRPAPPGWLYGLTSDLFPAPEGCSPEFQGENFSLLRCERGTPAGRILPPKAARPTPRISGKSR